MSEIGHVVATCNSKTVERSDRWNRNMGNETKEVQVKLMKGLLDLIIHQFLNGQPMHGYQIITKIRKTFGVYFGPSTIYPLLGTLEKKGYVKSQWNMNNERPRKEYMLTSDGRNLLNFTEDSLNLICKKIGNTNAPKELLSGMQTNQTPMRPLLRKIETRPMI